MADVKHPGVEKHCANCDKKGKADPGQTLPKNWIEVYNPLYGKPWEKLFCGWRCHNDRRVKDAIEFGEHG